MHQRQLNALGRHIALVGFMGAGKTTFGREVASRLGRPFLDLDKAIEERAGKSIADLFAERGESGFRAIEEHAVRVALAAPEPSVLALGGGAVTSAANRAELERAVVVLIDVDVESAWARVRHSSRPLARDEGEFRRLYAERQPIYREVADGVATDAAGVILVAGGVHHERGALDRLGELVPGDGPVALVADSLVMGIYGARAQEALGSRLATTHELPVGEEAKAIGGREAALERAAARPRRNARRARRRLHHRRRRLRRGHLPARGSVGRRCRRRSSARSMRRSAARRRSTSRRARTSSASFHWPARVVLDETLLETLPERERRQGMAELVKTRLLAGRDLDVRTAAAYKTAICLQDPHDHGPRRWLNLGHTFAHGLEAAADFDLPHGEAVALGLLAALRLSGRDTERRSSASWRRSRCRSIPSAPGRRCCATRSAPATRSTSSCSARTAPTSRRGRQTRCGASSNG